MASAKAPVDSRRMAMLLTLISSRVFLRSMMLMGLIAAMEVDSCKSSVTGRLHVERELFPGNFYVLNTTSTLFANGVHGTRTCALLIYSTRTIRCLHRLKDAKPSLLW